MIHKSPLYCDYCNVLFVSHKNGQSSFSPFSPLTSKRNGEKNPAYTIPSCLVPKNYVHILLNKPQLGEFMKWAKPLIMVSESQR